MARPGQRRWSLKTPAALLIALTLLELPHAVRATSSSSTAALRCALPPASSSAIITAGRPLETLAFILVNRERSHAGGLAPLRRSAALTAIAERHSAYMASIGSWSDGDPEGDILSRVHDAGVTATYAGQNVVTATENTIAAAVQTGDRFFEAEEGTDGPHWANIANPNHRYVGLGVAAVPQGGSYTIYLTQVFSDGGGCLPTSVDTFTPASTITTTLKIGAMAHPSVDSLLLHTAPAGKVIIGTLHQTDQVQIVDMSGAWAQVKLSMSGTPTYGWVFAPMLTQQ